MSKRHRLITKLAYGSGSLAFGVKDNGFNVLLLLYYNQVLGLPVALAGTALALALAADALFDPVIGYLSDNTRSRWGRRHPYMYGAALPVALSYLLLWLPPAGLDHTGLFIYLFVVTIFVRTLISTYEIPSSALGPELTADYDERTSYMAYRYLFGWVGGVTMYVLAFSVFLQPDADHPVGQLNPAGYRTYAIVASLVMLVSIIGSSLGTHSAIPHLKSPPPRQRIPIRQSLREIVQALGNPSAIALLTANMVAGVGTGLAFALQSYFLTFFWGLSAQQIAALGASSFIAALAAMIVAPLLSRRFGKKTAIIAMFASAAVVAPSAILAKLWGMFPASDSPAYLPLLFVHATVAVCLSIVPAIIGGSMLADVVEDNQVRTGRRTEGVLFAANAFLLKSISGLGLGAGATVLALIQFPDQAVPGQVAPEVLGRMGTIFVCCIVFLYTVAIALVSRYRITRVLHAANLQALGANASSS